MIDLEFIDEQAQVAAVALGAGDFGTAGEAIMRAAQASPEHPDRGEVRRAVDTALREALASGGASATAPELARLTADAVVFGEDEQGRLRVLAVRRGWDPFEGCWALPGGHANRKERLREAARRELEEETGLKVEEQDLEQTGVYSDPERDARGRYVTWAFVVRVEGLPEVVPADDATETAWLSVDQVVNGVVPMAFDHRQIVQDAVRIGLRRN